MTSATPDSQPLQLGLLIYPGMTLLDLVGPQATLGLHGETHLLWKTLDPVRSDTGITVLPTTTFAGCPADLDVLFVPGGFGTTAAMHDADLLAFLAERGKTARYITSVCTGAVILGAAGLLDGYKAATHWATYDALEALGVDGVHSRVVVDRNRVTGGGVTAGLDFGLTLLAELRGETVAKMAQLMLEYDPQPPFNAGTPASAGPDITGLVTGVLHSSGESVDRMVETARIVRQQRQMAF
jgi:cyclohexyl-isocyanide hydratase